MKFETGQLVATAGVVEKANSDPNFSTFIGSCLGDYTNGDWGNTCDEDAAMNDEALFSGGRIFAKYDYYDPEVSIWIITEADRSYTTILFPEEYCGGDALYVAVRVFAFILGMIVGVPFYAITTDWGDDDK